MVGIELAARIGLVALYILESVIMRTGDRLWECANCWRVLVHSLSFFDDAVLNYVG